MHIRKHVMSQISAIKLVYPFVTEVRQNVTHRFHHTLSVTISYAFKGQIIHE
jgi:hypothetical protein